MNPLPTQLLGILFIVRYFPTMQSAILFKVSNKVMQYNSIKKTIHTVAYISIINQESQYDSP